MNIGITTLPFNWNYGGILQTYALQQALKKLGHEAVTIYQYEKEMPLSHKIISFSKRSLLKYILGKDVVLRVWPKEDELKIIRQHTDRFIAENIKTTKQLNLSEGKINSSEYNFDAFIVGSDQVWRPKYTPKMEDHFLGFLPADSKVKRISYAASFGTDSWEFNTSQTKNCSKLAKKFDAISVREDTGILLCKKHLGVDATLTLDPTLLVPRKEYVRLVEKDDVPKMNGTLFNYVLDKTPAKVQIINDLAGKLGLVSFSSTAKGTFRDLGKERLEECVYPQVTQWIKAFMNAEFVLTDSYHGTIFSILFNKQFFTLGNSTRGMARFNSLLSELGLENRLITGHEKDMENRLKEQIDFDKVNNILEDKKKESLHFLEKALTVDCH